MSTSPPLTLAQASPTRTTSLDGDTSEGLIRGAAACATDALALGRYVVGPLVRRGGQGEIYTALDTALGREVIIKRLYMRADEAPEWRRQAAHKEARLAATLAHPHILGVLDFGVDAALGPLIVLPLVPGALTLYELLSARAAGAAPAWCTSEALIDALAQLAGALAHVHENGLMHGDVHLGNLLVRPTDGAEGEGAPGPCVGTAGDPLPGAAPGAGCAPLLSPSLALIRAPAGVHALLIDFGLAQRVGPEPAFVAGVRELLAPELLAGRARRSPALDVYSFGSVLAYAAYGHAPRRLRGAAELPPPADDALVGLAPLVHGCLAEAPELRPTARAVERALRALLDGLRARRQADALLAATHSQREALTATTVALVQRLGEVERLRARLAPTAEPDAEPLRAVWRLEDEIAGLADAERRLHDAIDHALRSATALAPGYAPAIRGQIAWLLERHAAAERAGAPAARALEERLAALRDHDPALGAYLRGVGRVELALGAPLRWSVHALGVGEGRVLRPGAAVASGCGERVDLDLPQGSYVAQLQRPGEDRVHIYPFVISRAGLHQAEDGERRPITLCPPLAAELFADEVWIPPGWHWVGGDPRALGVALPTPELVFTPAFACAAAPVTVRGYMDYVESQNAAGVDVSDLLPFPIRTGPDASPIRLGPDGKARLVPDRDGHLWSPDWPICMLTVDHCVAYAAWEGARRGGRARLPSENEWERAVRGADDRVYPWGHHVERGWARTQELTGPNQAPMPGRVGTHPVDRSVFGLWDAAGNVAAYTPGPVLPLGEEPVRVRGGSWLSGMAQLRICSRLGVPRGSRPASVGIRWVRELGPAGPARGGARPLLAAP